MKVNTSYYTAIGGRDKNEDAVSMLESQNTLLGIVADGLGGHSGGELASKTAVNTVNAVLGQEKVSIFLLRQAIEEANARIEKDGRGSGMKSTVAALWTDNENAVAANVGDTRIYQFRNGRIVYQSKDHSVVNMAVLAGEISEREIRGNKNRNQLMRALGAQDEVKPDIATLNVLSGDAFLICSDGFWENIWEEEMLEDLEGAGDACGWLQKMRERVGSRMKPNSDNHSAITIFVERSGD